MSKLKPQKVDALDVAFGGNMKQLMPNIADVPEEFRNPNSQNIWVKWQSDWFFNGLKQQPTPKPGIDLHQAMQHLAAIQRSFEPKHEHKMAAVAYLASLWFEKP